MINLEKIKMEPVILFIKENGKIGIINGHKRIVTLKLIGITELKPDMYNYSDNSYKKDIIFIKDIEDETN